MNDIAKHEIAQAIEIAKDRLAESVTGDIAVLTTDGGTHVFHEEWFWRQPEHDWEMDVVRAIAPADNGVFVVNVILGDEDENGHPTWLNGDSLNSTADVEVLFAIRWSMTEGLDLARCEICRPYTDMHSLVYGDIEGYVGQFQLTDETPGFTLIRRLMGLDVDA